jgi:hypothetical protein
VTGHRQSHQTRRDRTAGRARLCRLFESDDWTMVDPFRAPRGIVQLPTGLRSSARGGFFTHGEFDAVQIATFSETLALVDNDWTNLCPQSEVVSLQNDCLARSAV